jgi:hypothetical protein
LVKERITDMQQFIADARPWIELAYFASGIVLAVVALFGLKQISLLKSDIRLRSERAAKEKAIEQAQRHGMVCDPLENNMKPSHKCLRRITAQAS